MIGPRIYVSDEALTLTAFPLSDRTGYILRVGDCDHGGVVLGSVFRVGDGWHAYGITRAAGTSQLLGSGADLDVVIEEHFLTQLRLTDDLE